MTLLHHYYVDVCHTQITYQYVPTKDTPIKDTPTKAKSSSLKVERNYFETKLTSSDGICVVANTVGSSYSTFSVTNSSWRSVTGICVS